MSEKRLPKLRLCPFCGGSAEFTIWPEDLARKYVFPNVVGAYVKVGCSDCGANVEAAPVNKRIEAIMRWNRRASD